MNLRRLLTTPPPTTGWLIQPGLAVVVRRDSRGDLRCAQAPLAESLFEVGPVGLHAVDRKRLAESLRPLHAQLGSRRPAVVIPTAWVRSHLLDFDHLPRRSAELHEVVRWRLKKLLPVLPAELRLAVLPYPGTTHRQVLCMVGLERALADLEGALADLGIEPGMVTSSLFALAARAPAEVGNLLLVQHEATLLSLLLLTDNRPRLLRTKLLPPGGEAWALATNELQLAVGYLREGLGVSGPIRAVVAAEQTDARTYLAEWWGGQEGVEVETWPVPSCGDAAAGLDPTRLGPLWGVLSSEGAA